MKRTKSGSRAIPKEDSISEDQSFVLSKKLTFDSIKDKLNAQPNLFYNAPPAGETRFQFKDRMVGIMKWMCAQLLMSPYEIVHFITVFDDEFFDIINIR